MEEALKNVEKCQSRLLEAEKSWRKNIAFGCVLTSPESIKILKQRGEAMAALQDAMLLLDQAKKAQASVTAKQPPVEVPTPDEEAQSAPESPLHVIFNGKKRVMSVRASGWTSHFLKESFNSAFQQTRLEREAKAKGKVDALAVNRATIESIESILGLAELDINSDVLLAFDMLHALFVAMDAAHEWRKTDAGEKAGNEVAEKAAELLAKVMEKVREEGIHIDQILVEDISAVSRSLSLSSSLGAELTAVLDSVLEQQARAVATAPALASPKKRGRARSRAVPASIPPPPSADNLLSSPLIRPFEGSHRFHGDDIASMQAPASSPFTYRDAPARTVTAPSPPPSPPPDPPKAPVVVPPQMAKCPLCDKQYHYGRSLQNHVSREHGIEWQGSFAEVNEPGEFPCPHCDKVCAYDRALKVHISRVHVPGNVESHICKECGKVYSYGRALQNHLKNKHGWIGKGKGKADGHPSKRAKLSKGSKK